MLANSPLLRISLAASALAWVSYQSSTWSQEKPEEAPTAIYEMTTDPAQPFTKDGEPYPAKRLKKFSIDRNTLQITNVEDHRPMRGMGMGMDGGMGMGEGGYDGMGGMGMGSMGGMGMGSMGGGGMGGPGAGAPPTETVYAFVFDGEVVDGRSKIEVLTPIKDKAPGGMYMEMGAEGYGDMGSMMGSGMEGAMGGGMGGMSSSFRIGRLVSLESVSEALKIATKTNSKAVPFWNKETAKLVGDSVRLHIWKHDAIRDLKSSDSSAEQNAATEELLRELLSEEYDGQLSRQQLELKRLQERLKNVESEIVRRRQAKDRVVEVQLGKIVLESQGILGEGL